MSRNMIKITFKTTSSFLEEHQAFLEEVSSQKPEFEVSPHTSRLFPKSAGMSGQPVRNPRNDGLWEGLGENS